MFESTSANRIGPLSISKLIEMTITRWTIFLKDYVFDLQVSDSETFEVVLKKCLYTDYIVEMHKITVYGAVWIIEVVIVMLHYIF